MQEDQVRKEVDVMGVTVRYKVKGGDLNCNSERIPCRFCLTAVLRGLQGASMATIRKREGKKGVSWQIDYFDPNGKRVRPSFKKKKDAEAELGKRVSLIAEKRYLDVKKDYNTTLKELLDKYTENHQHQASFKSWKEVCLENFKTYFGKDSLLANIRYVNILRQITQKRLLGYLFPRSLFLCLSR
jgi:hypothetical protein